MQKICGLNTNEIKLISGGFCTCCNDKGIAVNMLDTVTITDRDVCYNTCCFIYGSAYYSFEPSISLTEKHETAKMVECQKKGF